jgi:heme A synthase
MATAAATFGLIAFGTLVTTFHVGMSDPLWPTAPWHLLLIDRLPNFGFYIEHIHRIAGYLAGIFILVETVALWWYTPSWGRRLAAFAALIGVSAGTSIGMYLVKHAPERAIQSLLNPGFFLAAASALAFLGLAVGEILSQTAGRWHRAIVTVAFVGVVAQGMLGGLRVYLNELIGPNLAIIHGLFAEVLFASTALLAVMTGPRWNSMIDLVTERPLRMVSAAIAVLVLIQIVFGGLLRHLLDPAAQMLHPLLGMLVAGGVIWLNGRTKTNVDGAPQLRRKAAALLGMVAFQVALGLVVWIRVTNTTLQFESVSIADATMRSLHVLTGFGIFASAVLFAARAWKAKLI